jgi:hypothetical protein
MEPIDEYFNALSRLIADTPLRVCRGSRISKDTVALEAGRGRGSIKKSRAQFTELIVAIEAATKQKKVEERGGELASEMAKKYRELYENALVREVSLLIENFELRRELAKANSAFIKSIK